MGGDTTGTKSSQVSALQNNEVPAFQGVCLYVSIYEDGIPEG